MQVVHLSPPHPTRWLAVTALAACGAIAWRHAHRAPTPAPVPHVTCAIPAIDPAPPPEVDAIDPQQFAVPPPGDPYPRPHAIDAELIDRPRDLGGCGTFLIESTMVFRPLEMAGEGDLRVLVPCAEMPRPMFSSTAGDAGVLQLHHTYRLWLTPADRADGKNDVLWYADRIDDRIADRIIIER